MFEQLSRISCCKWMDTTYAVHQTAAAQHIYIIVTEIHCGLLITPSNGSNEGNNDLVDSVVTFSCDHGYRLQGSANRTCTTQGTWDGVSAVCEG